METPDDLMTLREAAGLLGSSVLAVLEAIEDGSLPGFSCEVGAGVDDDVSHSVVRVRRQDVTRLLAPEPIEPGTLLARYPDGDFPELSPSDVLDVLVRSSRALHRLRRWLPFSFVTLAAVPLVVLAAAEPSWVEPDRPHTVLFPLAVLALPTAIPLAGLTVAVLSFARAQWSAIARALGARGIATLLGGGVATLVTYFAYFYWVVGQYRPEAFSEPMEKADAIYFAVTVFTTTGFGDITARDPAARLLVATQMVYGFAVISVVVAMVVSRGFAPEDD